MVCFSGLRLFTKVVLSTLKKALMISEIKNVKPAAAAEAAEKAAAAAEAK